jgi:hypothetical protein
VADTIYSGPLTSFDVTADGGRLVVDEGISQTSVFALSLADALRGVFSSTKPLLSTSAPLMAWLFPDGKRLLIRRDTKGESGVGGPWLSTVAADGGVESPVSVKGALLNAVFADSLTVALLEHDSTKAHGAAANRRFVLEDVRTHARRAEWLPPDSTAWWMNPVAGRGWVWMGQDSSVHVQLGNERTPRTYPIPAQYNRVERIVASPDGRHLALVGWKTTTADSLRVTVLSLADGAAEPWVTIYGEDYYADWLADGSFVLCVSEPQDTWTMYRIRGPGRVEKVGTVPRPISSISTSQDFTRAVVVTRDYLGDAWMFRVVRR